jgi:plastocyanin
MRHRFTVVSLALSAAVALAACGGDSGATPDTVPADADVVIRGVTGIQWDQDSYTATATDGQVLIATVNDSNENHDLNIRDAANVALPKKLETPRKGDIASGVFTLEPGTYTVFCSIVGHGNMKATLTVS